MDTAGGEGAPKRAKVDTEFHGAAALQEYVGKPIS
jgi:hypothetical protein